MGDLERLSFFSGGALFLSSFVSLKVSFIFSVSFTSFFTFNAVTSGEVETGGRSGFPLGPVQGQC